jgi:hypothetical protein
MENKEARSHGTEFRIAMTLNPAALLLAHGPWFPIWAICYLPFSLDTRYSFCSGGELVGQHAHLVHVEPRDLIIDHLVQTINLVLQRFAALMHIYG